MNCDTLDLKACRFTQGWCPHAAHQQPHSPVPPSTRPHLTHLHFRSIKVFSCNEQNHNEMLQVPCSPSAAFGCLSGCHKPAMLHLPLFSPTRTMQNHHQSPTEKCWKEISPSRLQHGWFHPNYLLLSCKTKATGEGLNPDQEKTQPPTWRHCSRQSFQILHAGISLWVWGGSQKCSQRADRH